MIFCKNFGEIATFKITHNLLWAWQFLNTALIDQVS